MEKNPLLLPASILLAGAMIGAGLFLGLRSRSSETAAPATAMPAAESPAPIARPPDPAQPEPPPEPPPPPAPASGELQDKVGKQVLAALEKRRAWMVKECWKPSFEKDAKPATLKLAFRYIFDPAGQVVVQGVGDPPEASRLDVARCIRDAKLTVTIPPPGARVGVHVEITLP